MTAHLLRLGYNAMPLSVDSCVDLLAHRPSAAGDDLLYQVQVKTTGRHVSQFTFSRTHVERIWQRAINLVVVFWMPAAAPEAVVFPPSLFHMMTTGGFQDPQAPVHLVRERAAIKVIRDARGRIYVRNRSNDFTPMKNRFDLMEDTLHDTNAIPPYAQWADQPKRMISFVE
ncbi:MAG: hypothetical protein ABIF77_19120 [bacterium]